LTWERRSSRAREEISGLTIGTERGQGIDPNPRKEGELYGARPGTISPRAK